MIIYYLQRRKKKKPVIIQWKIGQHRDWVVKLNQQKTDGHHASPDVMLREDNLTYAAFQLRTQNLSLIMRKQQTNMKQEAFYF